MIKKFNEFKVNEEISITSIGVALFGASLVNIVCNFFKKRRIFKNFDISKLEGLTKEFIDKKTLIGDVIITDEYSQVIYKFDGSDNTIVIKLYKDKKILDFTWDFETPIFPYVKYSTNDSHEIDLTDEEVKKVDDIIKKIQGEKKHIDPTY